MAKTPSQNKVKSYELAIQFLNFWGKPAESPNLYVNTLKTIAGAIEAELNK